MRTIQQRLERIEKLMQNQGRHEADCICFPKKESPPLYTDDEVEAVNRLDCRIHGKHFCSRASVYPSDWLLRKREVHLKYHSEQYLKAFYAHLPPELRPVKVTTRPRNASDPLAEGDHELRDQIITFVLKNGQEVSRSINGTYSFEIPSGLGQQSSTVESKITDAPDGVFDRNLPR